jgi:hypothetical protein
MLLIFYNLSRCFVVASTVFLVVSCSPSNEYQKEKILNNQHRFVVVGCDVQYNGKQLKFGEPIQNWINVLGSNYRESEASGRYVWDKIGIYVNTDWDVENVISLNFVFDNTPSYFFTLSELEADLEKYKKNEKLQQVKVTEEQISMLKYLMSNTPKFNFKDSLLVDGVLLDGNVDFEEIKNQRWEYYKANKKNYDQLGIGFHTFNQSYTPERWEYNIPKCPNGRDFSAIFLMMEPGKAATLTFGS